MNTLEIDTAPLASKQNLQQACAEAKATLRAWAAVPQERKLTGCIAQFKYLQSPVAKEHRRLGGLEGIHMAFIMANLDANNDGTVGEKEYQAFIAQGNEMVEGAKGLCLNNGVLSTLLVAGREDSPGASRVIARDARDRAAAAGAGRARNVHGDEHDHREGNGHVKEAGQHEEARGHRRVSRRTEPAERAERR